MRKGEYRCLVAFCTSGRPDRGVWEGHNGIDCGLGILLICGWISFPRCEHGRDIFSSRGRHSQLGWLLRWGDIIIMAGLWDAREARNTSTHFLVLGIFRINSKAIQRLGLLKSRLRNHGVLVAPSNTARWSAIRRVIHYPGTGLGAQERSASDRSGVLCFPPRTHRIRSFSS